MRIVFLLNTKSQKYMTDIDNDLINRKDNELVHDKVFYQRIFKRTERVIQAVFYITDKIGSENGKKDIVVEQSQHTATDILRDVSQLLVLDIGQARGSFMSLIAKLAHQSALIALLATRERIQESHAALVTHEIDGILSEIGEFREREGAKVRQKLAPRAYPPTRLERRDRQVFSARLDAGGISDTALDRAPEPDRKERIKTILRDKGQISIKDISDVIKDVSEKSIQRDLNDMIARGEIVRHGERRWSTYSIGI